jgi:N-acetylmuramoyl-L-alanine amidase
MSIVKDGGNVILSAKPNDIIIAELENKSACKNYTNCISGAFQYKNNANAILVYGSNQINNLSAHGWLGYPDSCLIYYKDGTFTVKRLVSIPEDELKLVQWAISGVGMLDMYEPSKEGYSRFKKDGKIYDYSDVLRKTNHTAIGVKDGAVYGFYLSNMTGAEVNNYLKSYGLDMAVMLDGGHIASVNSDVASFNASQKQHNIIQFANIENTTTRGDSMRKVFLNAGHGGSDPGAVSNNLYEKTINLTTMLKCKEELERHGVEVVCSRLTDENDPVTEVVKEANGSGAEIAVSFHANAGGGDGFEAYYYTGSASGKKLASLGEKYVKELGQNSRGIKSGNHLYFVKNTKAPAVLFESFFVDNAKDRTIGDTIIEQQAFGIAYAKAILEYFGIEYQEPKTKIYRVQVGAFSKKENADNLVKELKAKGYNAIIV